MRECAECGFEELEPRKVVEENEVTESGFYCPNCEEEYEDEPIFWEELDFPVWIRYEHYEDNYGMLTELRNQIDVDSRTIPDEFSESGSDFKYTVFTVWFKVDEEGNVSGPYPEKHAENPIGD